MKVTLNEIADLSLGKSKLSKSSKNTDEPTTKRNVLYHRKEELYIQNKEVAENADKLSLAENGDIIFKMADPQLAEIVSNNNQIKPGTVIPTQFAIIKVTSDKVDSQYLVYLLNSKIFKKLLKTQGIIKRVNISDLSKIQLNIPEIAKQQEIANHLKLIDEEIALEKQLINENENLKEGILQQFSSNK